MTTGPSNRFLLKTHWCWCIVLWSTIVSSTGDCTGVAIFQSSFRAPLSLLNLVMGKRIAPRLNAHITETYRLGRTGFGRRQSCDALGALSDAQLSHNENPISKCYAPPMYSAGRTTIGQALYTESNLGARTFRDLFQNPIFQAVSFSNVSTGAVTI